MPTFTDLAATFVDFLTVAIHTILYERAIYPSQTFLSARKYHYAIRQNRHPRVCAWIQDATSAVETELLKGIVARVALVIFSPSSEPLERFLFDLSNFPEIPPDEVDTRFERSAGLRASQQSLDDETASVFDDPSPDLSVILEEQFRAIMVRLSSCSSQLSPLPPGCTYTVVIENKRGAQPPIDRPQPWIPVQPDSQAGQSSDQHKITQTKQSANQRGIRPKDGRASNSSGMRTLPVRAVKAGEMLFEVWVEEGQSKQTVLQKSPNSKVKGSSVRVS